MECFLDALRIDTDLDPRSFLLQYHGRARVALSPAAAESFAQFGKRQVGNSHRHVEVAAQLRGERHVLVRQPQGKGGRLVLAGEKLIDQPVKGAPTAAGAVPYSFPSASGSTPALTPTENISARAVWMQ